MKRTTIYEKDLTARFHATTSNSKLGKGVLAIAYYPGDFNTYADGRPVSDVQGTCAGVCKACKGGCYAMRTIKQYEDACINRLENTLQLRKDIGKHFEDIFNYCKLNKVHTVRYTESGEIESFSQFLHVVALANRLQEMGAVIYLYTKRYNVLREYFSTANNLPDNMIVLVSSWGDVGLNEYQEFKQHKNVKLFAVNAPANLPAVYCPAYYMDSNGKVKRDDSMTCEKCGLCYKSTAKVIGCFEH